MNDRDEFVEHVKKQAKARWKWKNFSRKMTVAMMALSRMSHISGPPCDIRFSIFCGLLNALPGNFQAQSSLEQQRRVLDADFAGGVFGQRLQIGTRCG